jgi:hypothetical protein
MEILHLRPGDEIDFEVQEAGTVRLVPVKTIKVPRDQAWFWSPEWQQKEKEADADLAAGRYRDFESLDDLLKDMGGED